MALGDNIRERRTQLKMSQEYVAGQLGISRQAVAKWEAGKSEPSAANLAELAALFEMSIGDLTDPEKYTREQEAQQKKLKEARRNSKMHVGRAASYIFLNAGWDGYSSGLYSDLPCYWLAFIGIGLVLLFCTSLDMYKKQKMEKLQAVLGAATLFSIFFLPGLIPAGSTGFRYFLSDLATAACLIALNLKYWRHIWRSK